VPRSSSTPGTYEVYSLRDGKVVRVDEYVERAEALEAVGIAE
jgi:hypothetical protein